MMNRPLKSLSELQEEASLANQILGKIDTYSKTNSTNYASERAKRESNEYYYTDRNSFIRNENYTINGESVSKYLRNKNGR